MKLLKTCVFTIISLCLLILVFTFSVFADQSNTKSTAEYLQLNITSTIAFSPESKNGYYIDNYYNYYYAFVPTETGEYEFSIQTSDIYQDCYIYDDSGEDDYNDGYDVDVRKLTAGNTYYVLINCYVYDEPVWVKTTVKKHTHSYNNILIKADFEHNGSNNLECKTCGAKIVNKIPYIKYLSISNTTYYYTGKTITPKITVKDSSGNTLKQNEDYTISGTTSAKKAGKYSLTVKLKGNYTGSKKLSYKIILPSVRLSASSLNLVSSQKKTIKATVVPKETKVN